jgi:dTDP-D-glucose 4,6-dehydratase
LHDMERDLTETIEWYRRNEPWWRKVQRLR